MIDLHIHTKYSDGTDDCAEILQKAQLRNIKTISITDHNTALAYEELEKLNKNDYYNGSIIPGIELNTKILNIPIEILGYMIDYKKMNELVKKVYISVEERNMIETKRLCDKCIKYGITIDKDCINKYDSKIFASKFIHSEIIKNTRNKKYITEDAWEDTKVFYRKYMSNPEEPLYVEMDDFVPDFEQAANLIRQCGGMVFIPHIFEYRENSEKILTYILNNYKIEGIECYYTTFTKEQTEYLCNLCQDRKLYISGGSDYHGKNKHNVNIGVGFNNLHVPDDVITKWSKN